MAYETTQFTRAQRAHALTTLATKLASLSGRTLAQSAGWLDQYSDGDLQLLMLSPLGLLRMAGFTPLSESGLDVADAGDDDGDIFAALYE